MPDLLRIADRSWPLLRRVMSAHAKLFVATGGRIGGRLPGLPPMLVLEHLGARTGHRRLTPLVYMPDGDDLVIVAAKGGHPRHPAWVHNLRAHPQAAVRLGARRIAVHATEAGRAERERLWPKAIAYNPLWGQYQRRTERTIPVFVLRPAGRDQTT